jgi:septal ring factor EnvC (AmiA/AmiB activator)
MTLGDEMMVARERGQELHDRATRGLPLTDEERSELDQWYAQMNAEEARMVRIPEQSHLKGVQDQIDTALREIRETTQQILVVRDENRTLREQIAEIQKECLHTRVPAA